jgi:hypothetical protein
MIRDQLQIRKNIGTGPLVLSRLESKERQFISFILFYLIIVIPKLQIMRIE